MNLLELQLFLVIFPDMGELNSANYLTVGGYLGTVSGSNQTAFIPAYQAAWYPTASAQYAHFQYEGNAESAKEGTMPFIPKWRVAELSGKNPWFDSYEDYAQDIRGIAKSFSVLPEFRISQHMPYYADENFRKKNDKLLSLDGAAITSSAKSENSQGDLPGTRIY